MESKVKEWIKKIPEDKRAEVIAKIQKCEDKESILALAKEYDLSVTDETAESIDAMLKDPKILSEDDAHLISGGLELQSWCFPSEVCNPDDTQSC